MDDLEKSGGRLEVSVSFGRFENDALSWEKWSSFSPNKYLEEVGTLSTPGSVAQKKAYFEAHYKKIAARKAEEMEQENSISPFILNAADMSSKEDHTVNSFENSSEFGLFSDERLVEQVAEEESCVTALTNVVIAEEEKVDSARSSNEDEVGACMNGMVDSNTSKEESDASAAVESAIEETKDVKNVDLDNSELNVVRDASLVVLETPQKDSQRILERPPNSKKGLKQPSVLKKENPKLNINTRSSAQKVTPINKERSLSTTRKKVVTPPTKPLPASTPRHVKPASTPRHVKPASTTSPISDPQSLKKKVNNSAPPKIKSSQAVQSKRVAPTSLHMSLSLGPAESLGALPMTRKSLIMESMGDKDIVRRAFKTFQNRTNGLTTDEKPTAVKHEEKPPVVKPKMSSYHTPTKGNEGLRKEAEKKSSQRIQSGTRSNPLPTGLRKSTAVDKKNLTNLTPATGLISDEKAEKRKEFLKKLREKSIAREAENAQHSTKIKGGC